MAKELVIVSGKGGTGKTSVTASLAELVREKILVDCDVDASNLHLLVSHQVSRSERFIAGKTAFIDSAECQGCGICVDNCRFEAIKPVLEGPGYFTVDPLKCDGCGVCSLVCPEGVAGLKEQVSGEWFESETSDGPFLHAALHVAQSNSGRLVSLLKRRAREVAEDRGVPLILVDGPPGIGCPVIASISGASYILIVTEPSRAARHDMLRLLQLTRHFKLPVAICINKFDLSVELSDQIEATAEEAGVPLIGRLPFDPGVAQALVSGNAPLLRCSSRTRERFETLWENLKARLDRLGEPEKGIRVL